MIDYAREQEFAGYSEWLVKFFYFKLGARNTDRLDLAQDVICSFLMEQKSGRFDQNRKAESFIATMAWNRFLIYLKGKDYYWHGRYFYITEDIAGPEINYDFDSSILLAQIKKLKPQHREVLLMTLEGDKISQTAERLKIPVETVRDRKFYAIKLLKQKCRKGNW